MPARLRGDARSAVERHVERHEQGQGQLRRRAADARVLDRVAAPHASDRACQGRRLMRAADITRDQVEDFMYLEAELLDEWRLKEWLALFTADASYYVPATDVAPDASPDTSLFYVADDRFRLEQRVERLLKRTAH